MKRKRFSDEQIIGILKEADAGAVVLDLCRKHGMSSTTFYAWKPVTSGRRTMDIASPRESSTSSCENG